MKIFLNFTLLLLLAGCVNKPIPATAKPFPAPHNGAHRDAAVNQYKGT